MITVPLPVTAIFKHELDISISDIDSFIDDPSQVLTDEELKTLGPAIHGLTSRDRQQLKDFVTQALQDRYSEGATRLSGPESGWLIGPGSAAPTPSLNDTSVSNLALVLINDIAGPGVSSQYTTALCRSRIQLCLLRLHAKAIEYHWLNNRWPTKIQDFADKDAAFDPFAGEPFHYELKDAAYRLYSIGIPGLGPIELKYHPIATMKDSPSDHP